MCSFVSFGVAFSDIVAVFGSFSNAFPKSEQLINFQRNFGTHLNLSGIISSSYSCQHVVTALTKRVLAQDGLVLVNGLALVFSVVF